MGWQERFKLGTFGIDPTKGNASFRGVPFFVDSHKASSGKRLVEHEYPQSRTGKVEDLGPNIRRYSITASLVGDDHMEQRDALRIVSDQGGTGVLQHPYFGKFLAECKLCDIEESKDELRVTRVSLEFVQVADTQITKVVNDTPTRVLGAVDAAYSALQSTFLIAYAIAGIPYNEALQVQKVLGLGITAVDDAKKVVGRIADYFKLVTTMKNQVNTLFSDATELITGIVTLSAFGITDESVFPVDFIIDRRKELKDVQAMWNFSPLASAPSSTVIPSVSSNVLIQSVQVAGVIQASGLSAVMEFSSVEEASTVLTSILQKIDELSYDTETVLPDDLYIALQDLRTAVSEDIDNRSRTLSRLVTYNTNQALPGVVLSNVLYGTVDKETDLLLRNAIGHPGFVGGAPLQVLIDA